MFKKILVAVDGSEHALKAARTAGELARTTGGHVDIITAFDPIPDYLGKPYWEEAAAARMGKAEEVLAKAKEAVGEVPGGVDAEMIEGDAADVILEVAETRKVDVIVMGTRGPGALHSLLVGSQSNKVISHAKCPVLLVK